MKKKIITMTLITTMTVSVLTGCSVMRGSIGATREENTSAENQENTNTEETDNVSVGNQENTNVEETDNIANENQERANAEETDNTSAETQENTNVEKTENISAENQESGNVEETDNTSTESGKAAGNTETNTNVSSSGDIFSWQVAIDGVTDTFPCDVSELEANGWELEDEGTLKENEYMFGYVEKGEKRFMVYITNLTSEEKDYTKCSLAGISIKTSDLEDGLSVVLPGNLTVSEALTQEDVINAYGEPADIGESDRTISMKYKQEVYKHFEALFNKEDGSLISIRYQNL